VNADRCVLSGHTDQHSQIAFLILVAVVFRLRRARLVLTSDEVRIYGPLRDRVLSRSDVVDFGAILAWYSHLRWLVPAMLTLTTRNGDTLRVPAVQALVWNGGIVSPQAQRNLDRSSPALIARQLSRLLQP
jgi:hypothetical protein